MFVILRQYAIIQYRFQVIYFTFGTLNFVDRVRVKWIDCSETNFSVLFSFRKGSVTNDIGWDRELSFPQNVDTNLCSLFSRWVLVVVPFVLAKLLNRLCLWSNLMILPQLLCAVQLQRKPLYSRLWVASLTPVLKRCSTISPSFPV